MLSSRKKFKRLIFKAVVSGVFLLFPFFVYQPAQAVSLSGRILLQVQDKGQAWYINPADGRRYYLGRPADAFAVMRRFGLGISNADFNRFSALRAPLSLAGRIVLKVEDRGQAYYINPLDRRLNYLGRPADAFAVMRRFGLGVTNADLNNIAIGESGATGNDPASPLGQTFSFKYQNISRSLNLVLKDNLYQAYNSSPHVYSYVVGQEPTDVREAFYGLFLQLRAGDSSLDDIIGQARTIALNNGWREDQLAEYVIALVQYIPYDQAKLAPGANTPFYPYETLYLKRGICADKTFLAVALLRRLGYGAAVLDFPDINHSAAGVSCPQEYSLNDSGYCFIETTNYFPWSVIPEDISGQAQVAGGRFDNLFNPVGLGKIEIRQATAGRVYQGIAAVRSQVASLQAQQADINVRLTAVNQAGEVVSEAEKTLASLRAQLDVYAAQGQTAQYNALVPEYNSQVGEYNAALEAQNLAVAYYNQVVAAFNQLQKDFYQFD